MGLEFLTQQGGILMPFAWIMGVILNGIFEFVSLLNIQNIAVCIVIFTVVIKMLMLPLTIKQQKFSKLSAKMNPELSKITAKYKDKKDEESKRKMQMETQAVYEKYGTNPMGGCLPLLITLPIMFALYRVIYKVPAYVGDIYVLYDNVVNVVQTIAANIGASDLLPKIMDNFISSNSISIASELSKYSVASVDFTNAFIDILAKFNETNWNTFLNGDLISSDSWTALLAATGQTQDTWVSYLQSTLGNDYLSTLASMGDITNLPTLLNISNLADTVTLKDVGNCIYWNSFMLSTDFPSAIASTKESVDSIIHINSFLGNMNILDKSGYALPGILIPIIAAGTQFIQGKLMKTTQPPQTSDKPDNALAQSMKGMTTFMPIMSGVICVTLPIGVGIYWISSTVVQILQQLAINRHIDHVDVDAMIAKNVAKLNKRKEKLGINTTGNQMSNLAKAPTKTIDSKAVEVKKEETKKPEVTKAAEQVEKSSAKKKEPSNYSKNSTLAKGSSISDIANVMKDKTSDKK